MEVEFCAEVCKFVFTSDLRGWAPTQFRSCSTTSMTLWTSATIYLKYKYFIDF